MTIHPDSLAALPVGSSFTEKEGQAAVSLKKKENGEIEATAHCDSLTFFVTELNTVIAKLEKKNRELAERQQTKETVILREPTGLQWAQIYGFRIYALLTICWVVFITIKKRFKT